jgi:hypothetical protein
VISEDILRHLERLAAKCDPPPWVAVIEGRDQESGDSFIQTGPAGDRGEDIYVTRDSGPAAAAYLDLIAATRTYLPELIAEVRASRRKE